MNVAKSTSSTSPNTCVTNGDALHDDRTTSNDFYTLPSFEPLKANEHSIQVAVEK